MNRTDPQNKALHVWLRGVAEDLNAAGYDVHKVMHSKLVNKLNWLIRTLLENEEETWASLLQEIIDTHAPRILVSWNEELCKELLWRPVQEAMTGKESTTELTTVEISEVYEILSRHLGEKFGIHVKWPSNEDNQL